MAALWESNGFTSNLHTSCLMLHYQPFGAWLLTEAFYWECDGPKVEAMCETHYSLRSRLLMWALEALFFLYPAITILHSVVASQFVL